MASPWVRAFAPATVANVGSGFDVLGFAAEQWGDVVEAHRSDQPGVVLEQVSGDQGRLPTRAEENTAGVAALALLKDAPVAAGVRLRLTKGLPLASGLGSSAASAAAAVVAVNEVLSLRASAQDLLTAAAEGERVACGAAHADNVAPALRGGFVLVRQGDSGAMVTELPVPDGLRCVIVHPHAEVSTESARAVLPSSVSLADASAQLGDVAALVAALFRSDDELLRTALTDRLAEPARASLTPGFAAMRSAAVSAGALGCGLSGSGPSVFALCREGGNEISTAMVQALKEATGLKADVLSSVVGGPGARILESGEPA